MGENLIRKKLCQMNIISSFDTFLRNRSQFFNIHLVHIKYHELSQMLYLLQSPHLTHLANWEVFLISLLSRAESKGKSGIHKIRNQSLKPESFYIFSRGKNSWQPGRPSFLEGICQLTEVAWWALWRIF